MNELTYSKCGDYFIHEIALSEQTTKPLGKYGRLRRTYLQEHRQALFNHLILSEKLFAHLNEVDEKAQYLLDIMIPPMAKTTGVTEQLKSTDQMKWVGLMSAVKAQIEEIIFAEILYS